MCQKTVFQKFSFLFVFAVGPAKGNWGVCEMLNQHTSALSVGGHPLWDVFLVLRAFESRVLVIYWFSVKCVTTNRKEHAVGKNKGGGQHTFSVLLKRLFRLEKQVLMKTIMSYI